MKLSKIEHDTLWAAYTDQAGPFEDLSDSYCDCPQCYDNRVDEIEGANQWDTEYHCELRRRMIKIVEGLR
jgi:hypothetical protein